MPCYNQTEGSTPQDVVIRFESHASDVPEQSATHKPCPVRSSVPAKRFQFIDNSSGSSSGGNSTQVRRHVMQEFMRQKRWQERKRHESDPRGPHQLLRQLGHKRKARRRERQSRSSAPSTTPSHSPSAPGSPDSSQSQALNLSYEQPKAWADHRDGDGQQSNWAVAHVNKGHPDFFFLEQSAFAKVEDLSPDDSSLGRGSSSSTGSLACSEPPYTYTSPLPYSPLSAARTDPFDCLPMTLNPQDQELFDFYVNVMPACSYGFERRSPHAHNWYLMVFVPEAMKGAVCFENTILVHAANTQAWVKGLTETPASLEHRVRASQMLLQHFRDSPTDTSDASISATLSAAALEDFDPRPERRQYAWMHFRAAVQKIRDRGGPSALVQHKRLQMLINWSDYIFSGYSSDGPTFYFHHDFPKMRFSPIEADWIARQEVQDQCEDFLTFLRCTEQLALVQAKKQKTHIGMRRQALRFSAFQSGQPLERLLASPPGLRYTKTGQLKQILSRLAALLTLNSAIWEYRHSTERCEEFLFELIENVMQNELDVHLSVEALIQILLSGSKNPALHDTERPWFVGRMLKVAKRLDGPSFRKLNDLLLSYLTLGPGLRPVVRDWENELRLQILQAPLTSHVLPLMQTSASEV